MMQKVTHLRSSVLGLSLVGIALLWIGGCHRADSGATKPAPSEAPAGKSDKGGEPADSGAKKEAGGADEEGLKLKPEEVQKLGVLTEALSGASHAPEASGFGVVVPHETIAQSLADLRTAAAVARQSQAALARGQRLANTPGAMPLDTLESAERQSTVDNAALDLARQRLSSAYGQKAPWGAQDESPLLKALASGEVKLVRVTFPISALAEAMPGTIRLGRIGVGQTAKTWDSSTVWSAPADNTVPGRSFFAIFKGNVFGEGERLLAWTPVGEAQEGVLIPAAAMIISAGKYWCYIEEKPGNYVRTEFDPAVPVSGGYFVSSGVEAGDKVVVKAAGQLLAKELNPATEAE